jgi:hypothetical protein
VAAPLGRPPALVRLAVRAALPLATIRATSLRPVTHHVWRRIAIIYEQSGRGNHLANAPAGERKMTPDDEANATALKLTISGHTVYGVQIPPSTGYRNNKTSGIAIGDQRETEYMVTSGTFYTTDAASTTETPSPTTTQMAPPRWKPGTSATIPSGATGAAAGLG